MELKKKKCKKCGKLFQPKRENNIFCHNGCAHAWHNTNHNRYYTPVKGNCAFCEEEFTKTSSKSKYCCRACKHKDYGRDKNKPSNVEFLDKKIVPNHRVIEKFVDLFVQQQKLSDAFNTQQVKATIKINTDVPIGIVPWGDWHDGGQGVDYAKQKEHTELFAKTKNLYYLGMGDYKDNYFIGSPHPDGISEQVIAKISVQDETVRYFFHKSQPREQKWLAMCKGHHDDWDTPSRGTSMIQELAKAMGCVNLWFGGYIRLWVNDILYEIVMRHSYMFESQLNPCHANKRMFENLMQGDIMILAHKHFPAVEQVKKGSREILCVRPGSYKIWDEYAQKIAGWKGQWNMPIIVLYPKKKKMMAFKETEIGIEYLNKLSKSGKSKVQD